MDSLPGKVNFSLRFFFLSVQKEDFQSRFVVFSFKKFGGMMELFCLILAVFCSKYLFDCSHLFIRPNENINSPRNDLVARFLCFETHDI